MLEVHRTKSGRSTGYCPGSNDSIPCQVCGCSAGAVCAARPCFVRHPTVWRSARTRWLTPTERAPSDRTCPSSPPASSLYNRRSERCWGVRHVHCAASTAGHSTALQSVNRGYCRRSIEVRHLPDPKLLHERGSIHMAAPTVKCRSVRRGPPRGCTPESGRAGLPVRCASRAMHSTRCAERGVHRPRSGMGGGGCSPRDVSLAQLAVA